MVTIYIIFIVTSFPIPALLEEKLSQETRPKFFGLNKALVNLIDEYDMVNFIPLNIKKESSLENIMMQIDFATQYSEGLEPKEPEDAQGNNNESDD